MEDKGVQTLKRDIPASLVVFLVAVPLSLGIAVASGAPIMGGLIAAVVGGIVAGLLAGAPLQVSGPAAGLTVVVFSQVQQFGWPVTCAIAAAAGLLQLLLGFLKVARGALAIAPAVVHGMLAGIGITIALAQLHVVLGGAPESSAVKNLKELPGQIADLHGPATFLGLFTIALLFGWKFVPKKLKAVPGPLVAVITGTLIAVMGHFDDVKRVDLPANLFGDHVLPQLPASNQWGAFAVAAVTIAIIASIESLLCAVATDKLHDGARANLDKELVAQGGANLVSGLLGGLPVTGVIVRSSANIQAGGKTRLSAILHGVWVLVFVLAFAPLLEKIPLSVLAGLLVYVGANLVNKHHIEQLKEHRELPIYVATVAGVVGLNLLAGVGIGIALSILMTLRRLAHTKVFTEEKEGRWHVRLEGSATFTSVPKLNEALSQVPAGAPVDIDLSVDFMDHAAFEALHGWREAHERTGGKVDIDERHESWYSDAASGQPRGRRTTSRPTLISLFTGRGATPRREDLIQGIQNFESGARSDVRAIFSQLARNGQHPTELFITCCDSRVVPTLFTASGPGDLFKLRNIGNIVPVSASSGNEHTSVGAALEYSIGVLGITSVVVCGHSSCGAMQALLDNPDLSKMPHLSGWLKHAQGSLTRYRQQDVWSGAIAAVDQLALINVVQQLDNLRTYPVVAEAERSGKLRLLGMYFDIENAQVYLYDAADRRFVQATDASSALPA
jgi:carbonic anhydrase